MSLKTAMGKQSVQVKDGPAEQVSVLPVEAVTLPAPTMTVQTEVETYVQMNFQLKKTTKLRFKSALARRGLNAKDELEKLVEYWLEHNG